MSSNKIHKAFIVDDENTILSMMKLTLELHGFSCAVSDNPQEALATCEEFNPDIIISDVMMPGMNGFSFREKVLGNNLLKSKPFVFLTSNNKEADELKGYELQISDYISKSTASSVIIKKIQSILNSEKKFSEAAKEVLKKSAMVIQDALSKNKPANSDAFAINYIDIPYEGIPGGDFVETIKVDDDRQIVVVGDVMGKKWEAWFHSFPLISYIRSSIESELQNDKQFDPAKALKKINQSMIQDKAFQNYILSMAIILTDSYDSTVTVAGAGCYPLFKVSSDYVEEISPIDCALGLIKNPDYYSETIKLEKNEKLIAFTDGLIEATNQSKQQFGIDLLKEVLRSYSAGKSLSWIERKLMEFTDNKLSDDLTILEIIKN